MKTLDPLIGLDSIPREQIPAAIALLAARAMATATPTTGYSKARERCLTPTEVAARLGVHRRWIYNHAEELGALRFSRRKLVIPESNVERYLADRAADHPL